MVRFYLGRCRASGSGALNDIWIKRPLSKKVNLADFVRFLFKYVDKLFADNLSFLFRVDDALEFLHESFRGIDTDDVQA